MSTAAYFLMIVSATLGLSVSSGLADEASGSHAPLYDVEKVETVLELFTSQGCVSCPPANRILTRLAKAPTVLALGYHVDYWDYIGWRDTLGSPENTERQRDYANAFATSTIYTPQMVVNGRKDIIGSREAAIRTAMKDLRLDPGKDKASVSMRVVEGRLHITADTAPVATGRPMPILLLVTYDDEVTTAVEKGENAGKTVVSTNPVLDWRVLGMWQGKPMEVDLPLDMLKRRVDRNGRTGRGGGCAALFQSVRADGSPGPILAATRIEFGERSAARDGVTEAGTP